MSHETEMLKIKHLISIKEKLDLSNKLLANIASALIVRTEKVSQKPVSETHPGEPVLEVELDLDETAENANDLPDIPPTPTNEDSMPPTDQNT